MEQQKVGIIGGKKVSGGEARYFEKVQRRTRLLFRLWAEDTGKDRPPKFQGEGVISPNLKHVEAIARPSETG